MLNPELIALSLSAIVVMAIGAQWLAWRLRFPAILLLLLVGLLAGPVCEFALGWRLLDPDALLGELVLPGTSLAVGLILFEGGMSLRLGDARAVGNPLTRLVSVGALVTWLCSAGAAWAWGLFDLELSFLLGAIVVVTGPTVIGPLLRQIRPTGQAATVLRWEGIAIDPIGATLALLVFEAVLTGSGAGHAAFGFLRTLLTGAIFGCVGAALIVAPLRRHAIPDFLDAPIAVMAVLGVYSGANLIQPEAGLLAATVMGVVVGNALGERARKLLHFKESLVVLLISVLFVVLTARLRPEDLLAAISWQALGFLATLVVLVRPLAVLVATVGTSLTWRDRALLASVAPRGIVAASVASVFALRLVQSGRAEAAALAPITFMVILGTVAVYALSAPAGGPVARSAGLPARARRCARGGGRAGPPPGREPGQRTGGRHGGSQRCPGQPSRVQHPGGPRPRRLGVFLRHDPQRRGELASGPPIRGVLRQGRCVSTGPPRPNRVRSWCGLRGGAAAVWRRGHIRVPRRPASGR